MNMTKELPLTISFIESPGASEDNVSWEIQPKSIRVYGDADRLRAIDSISLGEFNLANLRSSSEYNYSIPIPEGCENLSGVTWASLKASFKDMTSASRIKSARFVRAFPSATARLYKWDRMVFISFAG